MPGCRNEDDTQLMLFELAIRSRCRAHLCVTSLGDKENDQRLEHLSLIIDRIIWHKFRSMQVQHTVLFFNDEEHTTNGYGRSETHEVPPQTAHIQ